MHVARAAPMTPSGLPHRLICTLSGMLQPTLPVVQPLQPHKRKVVAICDFKPADSWPVKQAETDACCRYFAAAARSADQQEFQGLRPGKLSSELRTALGLGPLDPPPWLPRMRQLGYPPGYTSKAEPDDDQPVEDRIDFLDDAHARPVSDVPLDGIADDHAQLALPAPPDKGQHTVEQPADDDLDFIPFGQESDDMHLSASGAAQAEVSEARTSAAPSTDPSDSSQQAPLSRLVADQLQEGSTAQLSRAESREQQLVQFPGINAPLPQGADPRAWSEQVRNGAGQKMGPGSRAVDIPPAKRPRLASHSSASAASSVCELSARCIPTPCTDGPAAGTAASAQQLVSWACTEWPLAAVHACAAAVGPPGSVHGPGTPPLLTLPGFAQRPLCHAHHFAARHCICQHNRLTAHLPVGIQRCAAVIHFPVLCCQHALPVWSCVQHLFHRRCTTADASEQILKAVLGAV